MEDIRQFLIVFDRQRDKQIERIYYGTDIDTALARYGELEDKYRGDPSIDVVLLGSDSIESIKVTHPNYFGGARQRIEESLARTRKLVAECHARISD